MTNVEKLKRAREELGWTQARLAKALQLDRSYLSQLETGAREIQPYIMERLEVVLEMQRTAVSKSTETMALKENAPMNKKGFITQALEALRIDRARVDVDRARIDAQIAELEKLLRGEK